MAEARNNTIPRIRVTDAERAFVEECANACEMSLTDYVRYTLTEAHEGRLDLIVPLGPDLYEAIRQVADDEDKPMSVIVEDLLSDVFIGKRWFLVPVTGVVVDDPELGNKVIPFPQVKAEGEAA